MSQADHRTGCPECGGELVASDREHVCGNCGLVARTDRLDRGPEWRHSEEGPDRRRTGAPLTRSRHDRGLSTEIGYTSGADVPDGNPRRIARMRREHNRSKISSKADRNRVYGFIEIRRMCGALSLAQSIRERSSVIFERAQSAGLFQGRSIEGFAAASVYAACRIEGVARTRREVIDAARASPNEFEAAFDALNRDLGLPLAPVDPREYLPRFASTLELDTTVERTARAYAERLIDAGDAVGRKPGGVAGACLYRAAKDLGERINQRDVADVADVSPVTIRSVCALLDDGDSA